MYAKDDTCHVTMYAMADTYSFSQWLEDEMDKRQLTQAELARQAGVTRGAINGVLTGARGVGPDLLNAIAKGLQLPPETVFRAAGLLPSLPEDQEELQILNHLYSQLSDEDREDILALIKAKIERKEERAARERRRRPAGNISRH